MNPLVILACIVQTAEVGPPTDARCQAPYVRELTTAITYWSERYGIPTAIEAAKCYHESHFKKSARGTHGEIGICQPKPHGAIQGRDLRLTPRQLENVDTNVRISTRYLATFVQQCAHPSGWLTKYNRPARGCRPSRYSLGVLADLRAARRVSLAGPSVSAARSPYDTEASGLCSADRDTLADPTKSTDGGTSYTPRDPYSSKIRGTRESLPSDRRREAGTGERTQEEPPSPFLDP